MASERSGLDPTVDQYARLFSVDLDGQAEILVITHKMSAAFDILHDAGYSSAKIEQVLTGAVAGGLDPERLARKMVTFKNIIDEARR